MEDNGAISLFLISDELDEFVINDLSQGDLRDPLSHSSDSITNGWVQKDRTMKSTKVEVKGK